MYHRPLVVMPQPEPPENDAPGPVVEKHHRIIKEKFSTNRPHVRDNGKQYQQPRGGHMSLVSLIFVLVVLGLVMYLINVFIPMDATIRRILNIAVVIFLVIWLIQAFGLLGPLGSIRIGR